MNCKKIILMVLPVCWAMNTNATPINKPFPLKTDIDKNEFFANEITRFEFNPSAIQLTYDQDAGTFKDENTDLIVETDIPKDSSDILLAIRMTEATTACIDNDGNQMSSSDNLVKVSLELHEMVLDDPVELEFNDEVNGNEASKYDTLLSFKQIPEGASDCSGSVTMMLEFAI